MDGAIADELAKFKQYCNLIFTGPYSKKSDKEQASFISLWIGRQGLDCLTAWPGTTKRPKRILWKSGSASKNTSPRKWTTGWRDINYNSSNSNLTSQLMISCPAAETRATKYKFWDPTELDEKFFEQIIIGTKYEKIQERLLSKGRDRGATLRLGGEHKTLFLTNSL